MVVVCIKKIELFHLQIINESIDSGILDFPIAGRCSFLFIGTMSGRYSKVSRRIWNDGKFNNLSKMKPCGQALWLYILTCPENDVIPGLFEARAPGIADRLGWSINAFQDAFQDIINEGMAKADWKAGLVWIPKAIHYNKPTAPNTIKSWRDAWHSLPECGLKTEAYHGLKAFIDTMSDAFQDAFRDVVDMPCPIQEQEQEQEQEINNGAKKAPKFSLSCKEVKEVFNHWAGCAYSDSNEPKFTNDRKRVIVARLKEGFSVTDLKLAIEGATRDEWMVENNHIDIITILRNSGKTEKNKSNLNEGIKRSLLEKWSRQEQSQTEMVK